MKKWLWSLYVVLLAFGLIALTHRLGLDNFKEGDMGTVLALFIGLLAGFVGGYLVARNNVKI